MKDVGIIVAATTNGGIGYKNSLPWCIPEELKLFKKITTIIFKFYLGCIGVAARLIVFPNTGFVAFSAFRSPFIASMKSSLQLTISTS